MINRGVCTAANGLYMLANAFVNLWLLQVSYTVQHTVTTKQVLVWLAFWAMKISLWLWCSFGCACVSFYWFYNRA